MPEEINKDASELWIRTITEATGTREIIEDLSELSDEELIEKVREYPELQQILLNRLTKRSL